MNPMRTALYVLLFSSTLWLSGCGEETSQADSQHAGHDQHAQHSAQEHAAHPAAAAADSEFPLVTVYKSPTCGCCSAWADHMRESGFAVHTIDRQDMDVIKGEKGVPQQLRSCHTATVGDYVIEGHVPAADVKKLLAEKPDATGLAVPGMPLGSPGMEHPRPQDYASYAFNDKGEAKVFEKHSASEAKMSGFHKHEGEHAGH